jgi:hypothetical protein
MVKRVRQVLCWNLQGKKEEGRTKEQLSQEPEHGMPLGNGSVLRPAREDIPDSRCLASPVESRLYHRQHDTPTMQVKGLGEVR